MSGTSPQRVGRRYRSRWKSREQSKLVPERGRLSSQSHNAVQRTIYLQGEIRSNTREPYIERKQERERKETCKERSDQTQESNLSVLMDSLYTCGLRSWLRRRLTQSQLVISAIDLVKAATAGRPTPTPGSGISVITKDTSLGSLDLSIKDESLFD